MTAFEPRPHRRVLLRWSLRLALRKFGQRLPMKKFALVSLAPGDEVLAPTSNGSVLEEPEYMKLAGHGSTRRLLKRASQVDPPKSLSKTGETNGGRLAGIGGVASGDPSRKLSNVGTQYSQRYFTGFGNRCWQETILFGLTLTLPSCCRQHCTFDGLDLCREHHRRGISSCRSTAEFPQRISAANDVDSGAIGCPEGYGSVSNRFLDGNFLTTVVRR